MKIAMAAASIAAAGCFAAASAAQAGPLTIVEVGAPAVNCVFNNAGGAPNCTVVVDDSVGDFMLPGDNGDARLQTRTYPGVPPAPAAGDMAYVYRMDLTNVSVQAGAPANCVARSRSISRAAWSRCLIGSVRRTTNSTCSW